MTNKNLRRAFLASLMALMLCISSLLGTTYAWFTDSVTSSGNKIVAGSLKIDLELLDDGSWVSIKDSEKAIFDYKNWEPGYTEVKILKVENEGTLALKWMAKFISAYELTALADVIDVYVCPSETELTYPTDRALDGYTHVGTVADFVNSIEETTNGTLDAGEKAYLGIALKMQETAGNEYQGVDLGGAFDIMIMATQYTAEDDSFSNQYDKDAKYTAELDNLRAKLSNAKAGDVVEYALSHDAYVDNWITVPAGVTLKLNGNGHTIIANTPNGSGIFYAKNSNLHIQNVDITGKTTYAVYTNGVSWEGGNTGASLTNVTLNLSVPSSWQPINFSGKGNIVLKDCDIIGEGRFYENNSRNQSHIFCGAEINLTVDGGNVGNLFMNANYGGKSTVTLNNGAEVGKLILATDQNYTAQVINNSATIDELILQVDNETKLADAVTNSEIDAIAIYGNFSVDNAIDVNGDLTIYGDGNTITYTGTGYAFNTTGGEIKISDLTIASANGLAFRNIGGNITMNNVTADVDGNNAVNFYGGGKVELNHCDFTGKATSFVNVWFGDGRTATINGGKYSTICINASAGSGNPSVGSLTVNSATVEKIYGGAVEKDGEIIRENITLNNTETVIEYEK